MKGKNLYRMVYGYLLSRIYYNFYPKGEYLPSIHQLSDLFGVSTITVRSALRLLEQNGFISCEKNKRSVVLQVPKSLTVNFPSGILVKGDALQDLYKSLELIFPELFFHGLSYHNTAGLAKQRQILTLYSNSWDEPAVQFLAQMIKGMHNALAADLYYDVMLYSYPSYLASLASKPEIWETAYGLLHHKLDHMLHLKMEEKNEPLYQMILDTYRGFVPDQVTADPDYSYASSYCWFQTQPRFAVASQIIAGIFYGTYPPGSFLPTPRILAETFSVSLITVRRAITLLNNLGAVFSINGKGTKILASKDALHKICWEEKSVKKNILSYLEALQILALTCRRVTETIFPVTKKSDRSAVKEKLILAQKEEHTSAVIETCLNFLIHASDLKSFQEIYGQLLNLLIWGFPLAYLEPRLNPGPHIRNLICSLDKGDHQSFGNALAQILTATFHLSRKKAVSVGILEADVLILPV